MTSRKLRRKRLIIVLIIIIILIAGIVTGVLLLDKHADAPKAAAVKTSPTPTTPVATTPFDKNVNSTTDANSLWVVVNKQHPLNPISYAPANLVSLYGHQVSAFMSTDLQNMVAAAAKDGANLTIASSYRSYEYQVNLYNTYVSQDGQAKADTYSARPGYSEHQTGLAIDFGDKANKCIVEDCYADTPEGKWLAANAWQFGYILRYTAADQSVTGYENEAWHYRYVGQPLSREMHKDNVPTLEQFFTVTGGATYNTDTPGSTAGPSQE